MFDYVEFTNVLYLMSREGQQLAMANIAKSMTTGGYILINDIGGYVGTPLFARLKGWLDDKTLRDLGLEFTEESRFNFKDNNKQGALLRKT